MIPEDHLYPSGVFRNFEPEYLAFAGITATQINRFRLDRRYCGRCGHPTIPSTTERACICPECGQIEYPKISPAVIIAIVDTGRDKILLTRYAGGSYRHWALVAGFVEVGETFKGAARREIMEEVGLKVSDLVYYKSQPWSFSDSAMIGFSPNWMGILPSPYRNLSLVRQNGSPGKRCRICLPRSASVRR